MDSIYGSHLPEMERIQQEIQTCIDTLRQKMKEESGLEPVEHCLSRIKSEDSMREKCRRREFLRPRNRHSESFMMPLASGSYVRF